MITLFQHNMSRFDVRVFDQPRRGSWFDHDQPYQAQVDRFWADEMRQAKRNKRLLFDGPLLRLDRLVINPRHTSPARLEVSWSRYRHFCASRALLALDRHAKQPWRRTVTPLGAQCYFYTREGGLILFRRSQKLSIAPGRLRGLGGTCDPSIDLDKGTVDLRRVAFREAGEELGLPLNSIGVYCHKLKFAAMAYNPTYRVATAMYWVKTTLSTAEAMDLPLDEEHEGTIVIPPRKLESFRRSCRHYDPGLAHYLGLLRDAKALKNVG